MPPTMPPCFQGILVLILTFIANNGFCIYVPLFSHTKYTPWSVLQDGMKKVHFSRYFYPDWTIHEKPPGEIGMFMRRANSMNDLKMHALLRDWHTPLTVIPLALPSFSGRACSSYALSHRSSQTKVVQMPCTLFLRQNAKHLPSLCYLISKMLNANCSNVY